MWAVWLIGRVEFSSCLRHTHTIFLPFYHIKWVILINYNIDVAFVRMEFVIFWLEICSCHGVQVLLES